MLSYPALSTPYRRTTNNHVKFHHSEIIVRETVTQILSKPHYWKYVASGEMILLYWTETGDCKMTSEIARWKSIWQKILHFTQVLKNQPITAKLSPKSFSKLSDLIWFIFKFFVLSHDYFVKTVMSKVCSSLLQLWNGRIRNAFTLKDIN